MQKSGSNNFIDYCFKTNKSAGVEKISINKGNCGMLKIFQEKLLEAGCDEAGRGCLARPVFAAAVILPKGFSSHAEWFKAGDRKKQESIAPYNRKGSTGICCCQCVQLEIDEINILKASFKTMHLAIDGLKRKPGLLLIDGNRFAPYKKIPHRCIIKGMQHTCQLLLQVFWQRPAVMNICWTCMTHFLVITGNKIKDMEPLRIAMP